MKLGAVFPKLAVLLCLLAVLGGYGTSGGVEYLRGEAPIPAAVKEVEESLAETYKEAPKLPSLFPGLKNRLRDLPPFFRDTTLDLHFRSFYFLQENEATNDKEAWTLGGSLAYESGRWKDFLKIGAEVFTSQKLYGPGDRDGTLLLREGQKSFTV
jgi:hypothetical protein